MAVAVVKSSKSKIPDNESCRGFLLYALITEIFLGFNALDMLGIVDQIKARLNELTFLRVQGNDRDSGIIRAYGCGYEREGQGKESCDCRRGRASVADHYDVHIVFAECSVIRTLTLVAEIEEPFVKFIADSLNIKDDLVVGESCAFVKFGISNAFAVCDHVVDGEPRMSVFEKLGAVDGAPADLTDKIKGFYGQTVIDGDMLRSFSRSAAGGRADAVDLLAAQTLCDGFAVKMSDLGETVFSVIGVSVSDKNNFHDCDRAFLEFYLFLFNSFIYPAVMIPVGNATIAMPIKDESILKILPISLVG